MKQVACVAELSRYLEALAREDALSEGPIAEWPHGKTIWVRGRLKTLGIRGLPSRWVVRWECPSYDSTGLFGKGLAGENGPEIPEKHLTDLPIIQ